MNSLNKHFGKKNMYIGGDLLDSASGSKFSVICPATEDAIADIAWAGVQDANLALGHAHAGFVLWSQLSIMERVEWMQKLKCAVEKRQEYLRECVMYEHGKTWEQTEEDYLNVVKSLAFYAEEIQRIRGVILPDMEGTHTHKLVYNPLGVVVAFLAWNFPLLNLGFKLGPALAAGCSIIIKPSSETPLSAYALGEICHDIKFPAGVVNILTGGNDTVSKTLSESRIPSLLTMIGSSLTGRKLMQTGSATIKRFSMELGGNAPVIVCADADLDLAASIVTGLKFANTGQICVAPNRVFVHTQVYESFKCKILERTRQIRIGFGRGSGATMGPLVNRSAQERISSWVEQAVGQGAKILHGGNIPASFEKGYYYEPTVLENVSKEMNLYREEIFGPVINLIIFDNLDEVISEANDVDAGLASYIFAKDSATIHKLSQSLDFGEVMVNGVKYGIDLPHGGVKESGIGNDCSYLALYDYLKLKRITTAIMN
jgi:succinate-semialdehyde dehydrogenase / glutarate-semialdehyde dehydrogenase